jgi:outer membrane protein W
MNKIELLLGIVILMAGFGPAFADTPSGTVRGYIDWTDPTSDTTLDVFGMATLIEADSTAGLSFFYEFRQTHRYGFELGLMFSGFDFNIKAIDGFPVDEKIGDAAVLPVTFGVDIHLLSQKTKPDLYVAPLISINLWSELEYEGGSGELENDFGYGAVVGLDIPFGSGGWQFNLALRYLKMKADDGQDAIEVDPFFVQVGAGYRF